MQLARPCRSIVSLRSSGEDSSRRGTQVAHHDDMRGWARSAPLKMPGSQTTHSGKRLDDLRFR